LEGSLRGKFLESHWTRLQRDAVRDYFNDLLSWDELKRLAKDSLDFQRESEREVLEMHGMLEESENDDSDSDGGRQRRSGFAPTFDIELPKREQKRAAVLLEIQVQQAAEHPDVVQFRSEYLGGRLLSAGDAETYIAPGPRGEITDRALARIGRRLARDFGWHRDDAAWFVLTGQPPALRPLAVDAFMTESIFGPSYCRITLHAAPWVPPEVVERAFVQMRDQVRRGLGPGTVGEQRLEVLRFVEEERAKPGRRPSFEALLETWNRKYPHWAYADYRALSKAYREARQQVVYPEYAHPHRAKTPNMERQEARHRRWLAAVKERYANLERRRDT
jgi:hypothetical protein